MLRRTHVVRKEKSDLEREPSRRLNCTGDPAPRLERTTSRRAGTRYRLPAREAPTVFRWSGGAKYPYRRVGAQAAAQVVAICRYMASVLLERDELSFPDSFRRDVVAGLLVAAVVPVLAIRGGPPRQGAPTDPTILESIPAWMDMSRGAVRSSP